IGDGCYWPGFNLTCDSRRGLLVSETLQVVEISMANSTVRVMDSTGGINISFHGTPDGNGTWGTGSARGVYVMSEERNQFVVTGCNVLATLLGDTGNVIIGCSSFCSINDRFMSSPSVNALTGIYVGECSGIGCCQTAIPIGRPSCGMQFRMLARPQPRARQQAAHRATTGCPMDAARSACQSSHSSCRNVSSYYRSGYVCQCQGGYQGNPYIADGCQDIDECLSIVIGVSSGAGLLLLVLGSIFLTRKLKHRREQMQRQKFFKQNRGHLLQQFVYQKADIAGRMIISLAEMEKVTNNFDKAREIGGGGHGTVYKGILSDLHVVAIKKSKVTIQREIDEFINEVAILSQVSHRNVVKLFGCCLETEVPLLVYKSATSLPWEDRLRIATETARALAYLHLAVSFPIVHRDIKSQNILLDDTLIAKVSDFGTSRGIHVDQTRVAATTIQGTLGYLDPMYCRTGRLTEKSDVYSFGVLVMELLTRNLYRSSEEDNLVTHFISLHMEGNLARLLDPQIMKEGGKEVEEVAALAAVCVRLEGEHRPIMSRSVEASRQYSLEEEYLLSSRYPR
ncbi:hypothetical protein BRADI_3g48051v3, partial [Brachypodium distachyon]